jgi:segregation and condensation protein A
VESRLDLSGVTPGHLRRALKALLERSKAQEESLNVAQRPAHTIEGQIQRLRREMERGGRVTFRDLLSARPSPPELAVTLLAVLELVKRREVDAQQLYLFGPIEIVVAAGNGEPEGSTP